MSTTLPTGYYISAVGTGTQCGTFKTWTLSTLASGVTACAEVTTVPAGYYISAIARSSQCEGDYGWTLNTLASGVTACAASTVIPVGYYLSAIVSIHMSFSNSATI